MRRWWTFAGVTTGALALGASSAGVFAQDDPGAGRAGSTREAHETSGAQGDRDAGGGGAGVVDGGDATAACVFPRGVIDRAGHCCLAGQRWSAGACAGAPSSCAPGETRGENGACGPRPERPRGDAGLRRERFEDPAVQGIPTTMVVVPGGLLPGERGWIELGPFAIDRTEVSAGAYRRCVDAGVCVALPDPFAQMVDPAMPVVNLTRAQALRYCGWAGGRLPTSAEWQLAARGFEGSSYPWGERLPECDRARLAGCGGPARVGSIPGDRSAFGLLDAVGNVSEWVLDLGPRRGTPGPLERDPGRDPQGPRGLSVGGSFVTTPAASHLGRVVVADPLEARVDRGFRCARGL